jgi:hypothetical protein
VEYFCYISRSKIDQLYQNYFPNDVDEWTEQQTTEHDIGASADVNWSIAHILSLFKTGITYGRKGVMQREKKVKLYFTAKLRKVLLAIAKEKQIPPLSEALTLSTFNSLYYHHYGLFKIEKPIFEESADRVITIHTTIKSRILFLDCSLRFFSEANDTGETFSIINSTNSRFFSGEVTLPLETVFLLLSRDGKKIIGTPLYLKLSLDYAKGPRESAEGPQIL